jgi:hypothetical protein
LSVLVDDRIRVGYVIVALDDTQIEDAGDQYRALRNS